MTHEEKLLIELSKYTINEKDLEKIKQILDEDINWHKIFELSVNTKVIGLIYYNLHKYNVFPKIKPLIYALMKYYYICNKEKNIFLLEEKEKIIKKFNQYDIPILALKGGSLLKKIYIDYGSRTCNDLDFFCKINDSKKISKIMLELGYKQGEYVLNNKKVMPFERSKKIGWKLSMNTFPLFVKVIEENKYIDFLEIDFSFSFDLRKDISISDTVFEASKENEMSKLDSVIYLCCHLYKEAENDIWINAKADLNLSKFCDIRECCVEMQDKDVDLLVDRAFELNCQEAIYYCSYYLFFLYKENKFNKILEYCKKRGYCLKNTRFDTLDFSQENYNSFIRRLFSYDNS